MHDVLGNFIFMESTKMLTLLLLPLFLVISTSQSTLKFLVIADWGGLPMFPYKTFVEMNIGREMAAVSERLGVDFVLALGDNFYLSGVTSVEDLRFKETFETAFNYSSLNIPWYLVAGNHDHYGNVSAQILYSTKSARWNFPDFYYLKSYRIGSSNSTIDIVMLDTVILCGNTEMSRESQPLLDPLHRHRAEDHWKWLEKALKTSTANYLLVCGHFPVFSIGSHGSTECLVERLQPLLQKYEVTAYFSGHDHNIQHIQVKNNSLVIDYFVSGSSNFIDPSMKHGHKLPPDSLLFHWGNPFSLGAFTSVEVSAENMTVSFLSSFGKTMYSYSKKPIF